MFMHDVTLSVYDTGRAWKLRPADRGAHSKKFWGGVPNFLGPTFMANQYPNNNHIKIFI
jgi:hypothetical protein